MSFLPFFFLSAIPGFNPDIQTTDCRVKPDNDRKEREKPDYDKNKKNGHDKKEKAGFLPPFKMLLFCLRTGSEPTELPEKQGSES